MTHEDIIKDLNAMLVVQTKLTETAVDMLKPAIAAAVQKERDALVVMFLEAHEGAKDKHNHWLVAANKIKERT